VTVDGGLGSRRSTKEEAERHSRAVGGAPEPDRPRGPPKMNDDVPSRSPVFVGRCFPRARAGGGPPGAGDWDLPSARWTGRRRLAADWPAVSASTGTSFEVSVYRWRCSTLLGAGGGRGPIGLQCAAKSSRVDQGPAEEMGTQHPGDARLWLGGGIGQGARTCCRDGDRRRCGHCC